ncbi:MAG: 2,3-bisphosphoglycerate-independent phosphoglycerate mutase [Gammaproteobacteria bacterium]
MKPMLLIVLDGFGHREAREFNAIAKAHTPCLDALEATAPHMLLSASGLDVGLPAGQMGNSEVGHMNMGAGRVVYQMLTRIDKDIETGAFAQNAIFLTLFDRLKKNNNALHVLGLLSDGGVHSHESQIIALLTLAAQHGIEKIYLHAFLDGRDTPPQSAMASLVHANDCFQRMGRGRIASVCGRYFAMDRDKRWPRTQAAFELVANGKSEFTAPDAMHALEAAYARKETDEFVSPTVIGSPVRIEDGDGVIFMNFRADRARQLTRALTEPDFKEFERTRVPQINMVSLTEYSESFTFPVAYPPEVLTNTFPEVVAEHHLTQLRIAETEKYAHVTFFFSGGKETVLPLETRMLVPSPKVSTYDKTPQMSAPEITDKLVEAIQSQQFDFIVCNYANPDMLGHTGNFDATVKSIEVIDQCLARVIAALEAVGGECLITADHGNAECMFDPDTKQAHTAHTSELVPLIYVGKRATFNAEKGVLADIAPTLCALMGLPIPKEMTGRVLCDIA